MVPYLWPDVENPVKLEIMEEKTLRNKENIKIPIPLEQEYTAGFAYFSANHTRKYLQIHSLHQFVVDPLPIHPTTWIPIRQPENHPVEESFQSPPNVWGNDPRLQPIHWEDSGRTPPQGGFQVDGLVSK